jgi:hypothetical protein
MEFAGHEIDTETTKELQEFDGIKTDNFLKGDVDCKRELQRLTILSFEDEDSGWTLCEVSIFFSRMTNASSLTKAMKRYASSQEYPDGHWMMEVGLKN